jgi:hypothetical protein
MTPEERDIVGRFIARVGGAQQGGFSGGSSVPATQTALPPIDPEADRFIGDQFNANPQARYRITQMAFVQEAALAEAQNRIKRLEYDLQQAQQALQQAQSQGPQRSGGGLFSGLFGGGQPQPPRPAYQPQYAPPPPQPSYPPGYQPGMFRSGGSGFLGSALTTAAGVAGGVLAADALTSMFSGHGMGGGFGGGFGGGGFGGGEVVNETVVNNYGTDAGADPWAGGGTVPDAPAGGWSGGDAGGSDAWSGSGDPAGGGGWGGGGDSGGGWDDNSGGGDGGF